MTSDSPLILGKSSHLPNRQEIQERLCCDIYLRKRQKMFSVRTVSMHFFHVATTAQFPKEIPDLMESHVMEFAL